MKRKNTSTCFNSGFSCNLVGKTASHCYCYSMICFHNVTCKINSQWFPCICIAKERGIFIQHTNVLSIYYTRTGLQSYLACNCSRKFGN